jgi:hypothetical protein
MENASGSGFQARKAIRPPSAVRDPAEFAKVFVDPEAGTIAWPNEIDIDPDTLYELAHPSSDPR